VLPYDCDVPRTFPRAVGIEKGCSAQPCAAEPSIPSVRCPALAAGQPDGSSR
jgi:hypothetical protein